MKLATLRSRHRDGRLVVVSHDLTRAADATSIAPTLQFAIENWEIVELELRVLYDALNAGLATSFRFDVSQVGAPLRRAYQWLDASAFVNHGELMAKAFNVDSGADSYRIPLMHQGAADDFLGARDDVPLPDEAHGIDFEGEYAVIVDEVPMGCGTESAAAHVKLLMLVNDVSLRSFAAREMKAGWGFIHAKPSTVFGPVAVTPDELGNSWRDGRVHLSLEVKWNDRWFGSPGGGEMTFSFFQLIAHAATTRRLRAGTIIGSGAVSNAAPDRGCATIAERRALEVIAQGAPQTAFMKFGDRVHMQVRDDDGYSVFGAIDQRIVRAGSSDGIGPTE